MNEEELSGVPSPDEGIAKPDYTLDSILYSMFMPKIPLGQIGSVGGFFNQLRKKFSNPSTVLQLQDDEGPKELPFKSSISPSILDMFGGTATPEQKSMLSKIRMKIEDDNFKQLDLNELLDQYQDSLKDFPKKGEGDPEGTRSRQAYGNLQYWNELSTANQKQFIKAGLTEDQAVFFLSSFDNLTRDQKAAIEDPNYSASTFEFMKTQLLPGFLEEMKDLDPAILRPQLDHITQLSATLPLYNRTTINERKKINKILIKEGIYSGHNPKNFQYLDQRVHAVKSNYFNDIVGTDGKKFFLAEGEDGKLIYNINTRAGRLKAIKDYAAFVRSSYKIVEDANNVFKAEYGRNLEPEEVSNLLYSINPLQKYTLPVLKEMMLDLGIGVQGINEDAYGILRAMINMSEDMPLKEIRKRLNLPRARKRKLPTIEELQIAADEGKYYQPLIDPMMLRNLDRDRNGQ